MLAWINGVNCTLSPGAAFSGLHQTLECEDRLAQASQAEWAESYHMCGGSLRPGGPQVYSSQIALPQKGGGCDLLSSQSLEHWKASLSVSPKAAGPGKS